MKNTIIPPHKIKISQLIGKTVFTEDEGKFIGKIDKVTFNHRTKKVASFIIKGSLWSSKTYQVMISNITQIGEDMVNVNSMTNCFLIEHLGLLNQMTFQKMDDHRVVTDEGKLLGTMTDMIISKKSFKITELVLDHWRNISINPKLIVLGIDEIIIPRFYENRIVENPHISFLNKFLHFKTKEEISMDQTSKEEMRNIEDEEELIM